MIGLVMGLALQAEQPNHDFTDTGNGLLSTCTSTAAPAEALCGAYVHGVADGEIVATARRQEQTPFCRPKGALVRQEVDITVAYLKNHPADRQLPASLLIAFALEQAWPCP